MTTGLNVNNAAIFANFDLFPPRDMGRGKALKVGGGVGEVSWDGANVMSDGVPVFAMLTEPFFLDVAYDTLDRPQICYSTETGESYIYFFNGLLDDYETLLLGVGLDAFEPAICNDYLLQGVNTVVVYLKNGVPTYRLQSDRFLIEYTQIERKAIGIKAFGYGRKTNSIQIIVGRWR